MRLAIVKHLRLWYCAPKQERLPCRPQADETQGRQSKTWSMWKFGCIVERKTCYLYFWHICLLSLKYMQGNRLFGERESELCLLNWWKNPMSWLCRTLGWIGLMSMTNTEVIIHLQQLLESSRIHVLVLSQFGHGERFYPWKLASKKKRP